MNNGKRNARCGAGVWVEDNHPLNHAFRVPGTAQTNNVGELTAVLLVARDAPPFAPLTIHTDSEYVIKGFTEHLPHWEDIGFIGVKNAALWRSAAHRLRARSAAAGFQWIKGHSGDIGNEHADTQAGAGATKATIDALDLTVPLPFQLSGAKMSTLTQSLAYRGIRERKHAKVASRHGTEVRVEAARYALLDVTGNDETDAALWLSLRCKDLRKNVQAFLFRALHRSQKVGEYWKNAQLPDWQDCGMCDGELESMEHILFACQRSMPTKIIWQLARDLWPHDPAFWPPFSIGSVLAAGALSTPPPPVAEHERPPAPPPGPSRLLRILFSESAHMIWVLRCERVIAGRRHSPQQIVSRWRRAILDRLVTDRISACKIVRTAAAKALVAKTWAGTLAGEDQLPENWAKCPEVLVGIRRSRIAF
ncbi:ribonuclease H-like protein [Auriscalpium vulgare]|uniref:Ribonuclease H-like protein n=1 Tax=Auriscalpium vulgare TaxID=40419 RepID=A0ACB8RFL7_9AGAM|nr:ribonuclease H-like protein [Auriscalpium vulgare]